MTHQQLDLLLLGGESPIGVGLFKGLQGERVESLLIRALAFFKESSHIDI